MCEYLLAKEIVIPLLRVITRKYIVGVIVWLLTNKTVMS